MAFWSWRRDLNPRPADYKSAALPTELRQPVGKTRNLAETFGIRNREFCLLDKIWAAGCMTPTKVKPHSGSLAGNPRLQNFAGLIFDNRNVRRQSLSIHAGTRRRLLLASLRLSSFLKFRSDLFHPFGNTLSHLLRSLRGSFTYLLGTLGSSLPCCLGTLANLLPCFLRFFGGHFASFLALVSSNAFPLS